MTHTPVEFITSHPKFAFMAAIVANLGAFHVNDLSILFHWQIPLIVMQVFQIGAWTVTIILGMISIHKWANKVVDKYLKKK